MTVRAIAVHRLVVLAYHDVVDVPAFRRQMDFLAGVMTPIPLSTAIAAAEGLVPLPRRAVCVTFDDGDRSVYERAFPLLRERGIPATVFVVAGHVGTSVPLWFREARALIRQGAESPDLRIHSPDDAVRTMKMVPEADRIRILHELRANSREPVVQAHLQVDELREMDAAGMEIGNHTYSHPCLDRCSGELVVAEIERAHAALEGWLGRPPRVFAYPNGNGDPRAEEVLARLGYQAAFLFDHKIGVFPPPNMLRISRVRVNSTTPMLRFRSIVSGLHPLVHHMLGRR